MTRLLAHVRHYVATILAALLLEAATTPAHAAGSNMPWEQPLQQILQSIEGPVAKIMAVIIIIVTGLTLAFGDTSGGFRRLVQIGQRRGVARMRRLQQVTGGGQGCRVPPAQQDLPVLPVQRLTRRPRDHFPRGAAQRARNVIPAVNMQHSTRPMPSVSA